MYINRTAEEIFKLAVIALSAKFFDNSGISVKKLATDAKVSEKQLHFWKSLLAVNAHVKVYHLANAKMYHPPIG